jgi:carbamoyltransferase
MGAAIYGLLSQGIPSPHLETLSLGTKYDDSLISDVLSKFNLPSDRICDPALLLARLIADGNVVGVHQGRSEFGPRALGNRSIFASPVYKDMKATLNSKIKFRESYRPFACICPDSHLDQFFENSYSAPYMTDIFEATNLTKTSFPSIVHRDGTCRVQSFNSTEASFLSSLFCEFDRIGHPPLLINTSFNLSGEPIVESPSDAIRSFYSSGLDYLLLGSYILRK